jgi:hypothetical protein
MDGHTDREDEARILELLRGASAGDLNAALTGVDLGELLGDLDDRAFGPDHREALLGLLARERLADLDIASRATVISALQRGRTGSEDEEAIRDVFLGTAGEALTALKNALDRGDDHRDLHQLVFRDLDDDGVRAALVSHIATEAAGLPRRDAKVLCDVDDTIYANWADERYPEKTVYPGLREFLFQLDLGPKLGPDTDAETVFDLDHVALGDLVILTARPGDRAGVVEQATRDTLEGFDFFKFTVLAGELSKLASHESMAEGKLQNFQRHRLLFPEYRYLFVGDSGQGDASFGATLVKRHGDTTAGVFIHDVVGLSADERASWRERGVRMFDTYLGAACEARELGLISSVGLERVGRSARAELGDVRWTSHAQHHAREAELAADVDRANVLLPPELQLQRP